MKNGLLSILYLALLLLHLAVLAEVLPTAIAPFSKLALVGLLLGWALSKWKTWGKEKTWKTLTMGLAFSLAGDALLLGEGQGFFGMGLGAFLLAHIAYAICFKAARDQDHEIPIAQKYMLITLGMVMVGIAILLALHRHLDSMLVPVAAYIVAITVMSIRAINRFRKTTGNSFAFVLLGAVLFMTSDTILAFHTFKSEMEQGPIVVMATYGLAQLSIALGVAAHVEKDQA